FYLLRAAVAYPALLLRRCAAHRALHSFPTRRSSDLAPAGGNSAHRVYNSSCHIHLNFRRSFRECLREIGRPGRRIHGRRVALAADRKSTRLNSSHVKNSYAVFCSKKRQSNASSAGGR